jgi:gas vesicle protein
MFIKLGIIAGIIILGGMIFSNEIDVLFPSTSASVVNSLKDDISNFGAIASELVEKRIDESIDKIVDKTSNAITDEISEIGNDISNEISDVRKLSQQTISEKITNFNPIESIQNIFTDNPNVEELTDSSENFE